MQRILIIKIIINLFFILDCLGLLELDKDEWHPNTDIRNLDLQGDIFYHELQYHYYQVTEGLNQRSNIRNPRTNYRQDRHFDIAVTWLANTIVDYQIQNDNTLDIFYANEAYVYDFEGGACYPDN